MANAEKFLAGAVVLLTACFLSAGAAVGAAPDVSLKIDIPESLPVVLQVSIEEIFSPSQPIRIDAAKRLKDMGPRAAPAIPYLLEMLKGSADGYTTEAMTEALLAIGEASLSPLIDALDSPSRVLRNHAVRVLGRMGDQRAWPHLLKALQTEGSWVEYSSPEALWQIDRLSSIEAFRTLINPDGNHRSLRFNLADFLWRINNKEKEPLTTDLLLELMDDPEKDIRDIALRGLQLLEEPRALEKLLTVLTKDDRGRWGKAAEAMGILGDPRAAAPLMVFLKDGDAEARFFAAQSLGRLEARSAVPALIGSLQDAEPGVRSAAAWALTRIADPSALEPLKKAWGDEDIRVRKNAAPGLVRLREASLLEALFRGHLTERVLERAFSHSLEIYRDLWEMGRKDPEAFFGLVREGLASDKPETRGDMIKLLQVMHVPEAVFLLYDIAVGKGDRKLAAEASKVLKYHQQIGSPPGAAARFAGPLRKGTGTAQERLRIAKLLEMTNSLDSCLLIWLMVDDDPTIQGIGSRLFQRFYGQKPWLIEHCLRTDRGYEEKTTAYKKKILELRRDELRSNLLGLLIKDPDPGVRMIAVWNLGKKGPSDYPFAAREYLAPALEDPVEDIRREVLKILKEKMNIAEEPKSLKPADLKAWWVSNDVRPKHRRQPL